MRPARLTFAQISHRAIGGQLFSLSASSESRVPLLEGRVSPAAVEDGAGALVLPLVGILKLLFDVRQIHLFLLHIVTKYSLILRSLSVY